MSKIVDALHEKLHAEEKVAIGIVRRCTHQTNSCNVGCQTCISSSRRIILIAMPEKRCWG